MSNNNNEQILSNNQQQQSSKNAHQVSYQSFDLKVFDNINYPFCPFLNKYEKIVKIGQGTFG